MTDNEIIKALELCFSAGFKQCEECPLKSQQDEMFTCIKIKQKNALDLINRQKAEIERLQKQLKKGIDLSDSVFKIVKAEAIKEFWNKAKLTREFRTCPYVYITDGDNLVKEMTEPTKIEHSSLCETETYKE